MTISRQDHIAQDQVDGLSESLAAKPVTSIASTAPSSPAIGDIWFNSTNGYEMNQWNGTAWTPVQFGGGAVLAGAIDATKIAAGTVVAGMVDGTTISGAQFIAHGTQGEVLVYNGTPAEGNLILAISPGSGHDAYGNAYNSGLTVGTAGGLPEYFSFYDSSNNDPIGFLAAGPFSASYPGCYFEDARGNVLVGVVNNPNPSLNTPYILLWDANNSFKVQVGTLSSGNGLQIGAGPVGKYYYEEVTLASTQSIPTGTVTQVTNLSAGTKYSDYGSAWNLTTGAWTCPVSGVYDWNVVMGLVGSLSNARCFVRVCKTFNTGPFYCVDDVPISAGNLLSATGTFSANAGDQYHVEVYQSSGAAHTLDNTVSYVHIGRRL